jgi:hypothetical protein
MGSKIGAFFQKKIFGVKVLYIAAVLVVILVVVAWKLPSGVSATEDGTTADTTDAGGDTGISDAEAAGSGSGTVTYPDTTGEGTVTTAPTPPTTTTNTADPTTTTGSYTSTPEETNETWGRKAIEWLTKNAGASVDGATIAIQKYLNGDQLSYTEGQLRDKAINGVGFPPNIPASGGTLSKPPVPKPVVKSYKAPAVHTISGSGDNTWTELAKLYYGSSGDSYVDLIQAANVNVKGYKHSGEMPKGTRLYIPAKRNPKMYKVVRGKTTAAAIAKANGISEKSLHELNDTTKFPAKVGSSVRVA